jgi:single-stranded DNA-specific DHH superfamily exonuclease
VKKLNNLSDLIESTENIIKKIKKDDKVCLIHHDDSDGCSSAALFTILIHNLTGGYPALFPIAGVENLNSQFFNRIKSFNPDFVFAFDISVDPKDLYYFKGFVLDHHIFFNVESRNDMPYFNPRCFEKDDNKVAPVSYITYKILKTFLPSEKVAWIAGIGVTEDHRVETCEDLFVEIKKEMPELLKVEKINQINVEKSLFGELGDMVRSGRMLKGEEGAKTAVLALVECKDRPDKLINGLSQHSLALRRFYEKVSYETQNYFRDLEKKARFYKNEKVIVYEQPRVKLKGLTSYIADKIRQRYPDWVSYVINKEQLTGKAKISIRLEQEKRKENLVSIINMIKEKMPSIKGGGHKAAIGVVLNSDDAYEFEKEFLDAIKRAK